MDIIKVDRSFVAADALAEVVDEAYAFGVTDCRLFSKMLRTQDNDHYLVRGGNGRKYVARVYQEGSHLERRESDYQFELDWLLFLHDQGQPVSHPIARKDGGYLGHINAPEGKRYYALFSYAEGEGMSLENEEHLYRVGAAMARIHNVSNNYPSRYERHSMDLEFLLDRPVERIQQFWGSDPDRTDDLELLLTAAAEARIELEDLFDNELHAPDSWGPIGGDFHHSSIYFNKNGPVFFNFDLCGYGWRAYDIAAFLLNTNLMHRSTEQTEAFFAGYYSQRQLNENEHAAISPFLTVRRVWLTGVFAVQHGLAGHTFIAAV
jgi:Ser/Thr protein kinase RdoA (MazF antagonist)